MKNRQGLTIATLIVAIVGLSIGFAAFSNTLTISSSATVNPTNTMRVVFSKSASSEVTGAAHSVLPNNSTYGDGATIDNSQSQNSILKDLHAKFTAPGQSVTYNTDLYVTNVGNYKAQLTGIEFQNVTGEQSWKKCVKATKDSNNQDLASGQMATSSLVDAACEGITISVTIGTALNVTPTSLDKTLDNQIINVGSSLRASVTISYTSGSAYVDGPMEVTFGNIVISATSAVDESLVPAPSVTPTNSSCFVSVIPGQINDYTCNDTNLVIADNLQLGTRSVESISFNSQKCSAFESMLTQMNPNYTCTNLQSQFNSYKTTAQGIQGIYNSFLGALATATYGEESSTKNSITTIAPGIFAGRSLTSAYIGSGITTIGMVAFTNNSISNLTLKNTLTTIGDQAFYVNRLTNLSIPSEVATIGVDAFSENLLTSVDFSNAVGLTTIGNNAFAGWSYVNGNDITTLDLSNATSLISIGKNAFHDNDIASVILPTNLTTIGELAFYGNSLTSVTIPNSVTTIGVKAFQENEISTLDLSGAISLTTIGDQAFDLNRLTSVTIPDSVTSIGQSAFIRNNLTTVVIGSGITSIGTVAFYNSTNQGYGPNALTSVSINVACDTYKTSFTNNNQFGWALGYSNSNIVWGTACSE